MNKDLIVLDKDLVIFKGNRVKFKRVDKPEQLVGGKFYIRFGLNSCGIILFDQNLIIGQVYEVPGHFPGNPNLKKINSKVYSSYQKGAYIRDNYLNDIGVGSVYGTTLYEFDSAMMAVLNHINDNNMIEEVLLLSQGLSVDIDRIKSDQALNRIADSMIDDYDYWGEYDDCNYPGEDNPNDD